MCFSYFSGIGGPQKTETTTSSIIWLSLDFGDTSKFGKLLYLQWLGFVAGIPLRNLSGICVRCAFHWILGSPAPHVELGVPSVSPLSFKDFPLSSPRSTEFCWAFACLFCFLTLLVGFRAAEGWGGVESRQGWRLGEGADHTNSATARITTGGTMNEDHICQARHKRRPRQSQTQTSRHRWGSGGPLAFHVQRILGGWVELHI